MSERQKTTTANAVLVVIGDIGRSPRMCYHAKSLADKDYFVELVGYLDSVPSEEIRNHKNIRLSPLRPVPEFFESIKKFSRNCSMLMKFLWIYIVLFFALLFRVRRPKLIMMQNPPGVPTMFVCWVTARLYGARLIIDWHNYTYSMLSSAKPIREVTEGTENKSGRQRCCESKNFEAGDSESNDKLGLIVSMVQRFEGFFGRHADLNICVTVAMRHNMRQQWNCSAITVYDKPPSWKFKRLDDEQKHQLYLHFSESGGSLSAFATDTNDPSEKEATRFSFRDLDGVVHLRSDRPFLLVSSTSWTEDEDFGYLLDALVNYDKLIETPSSGLLDSSGALPSILCVITGKGPLKAFYLEQIRKIAFKNVTIITPWLEAKDYPLLLGSADIGVSLHTSTSGLDLPMKALDMFGSGLPVIGKRFPAIGELIQDGNNGYLFDNPDELCDILRDVVQGFPRASTKLNMLSSNVSKSSALSWEKNWDESLWPEIEKMTCSN